MFAVGFAVVIGLYSIGGTPDDEIKKDKELLQGGWQVVSWVENGQQAVRRS